MSNHHQHNVGFNNFSGALLGLRLAPLVGSSAVTTVPTEISDCFAQIELFLHHPQTFEVSFSAPNSLLNAVPILLRYRQNDFMYRHQQLLFETSVDEVSTLCSILSDALSMRPKQLRERAKHHELSDELSSERSPQYASLWETILTLSKPLAQRRSTVFTESDRTATHQNTTHQNATRQNATHQDVIGGIASALLYPRHYTLAVTHATQWNGLAPYIAGLVVGNWIGQSALPLLLQLQIENQKTKKQLLSRTYCQTIAKRLFDQWAGRRDSGSENAM